MMTRTRRRTARLITAVALVVPALLGSVATSGPVDTAEPDDATSTYTDAEASPYPGASPYTVSEDNDCMRSAGSL